jgi:hypothetical protein
MNYYENAFVLLVSTCGLLTWKQYHTGEKSPEEKALTQPAITPRARAEAGRFTRLFLAVYCLVMGSDWLQGTLKLSLLSLSFTNECRSLCLQLI